MSKLLEILGKAITVNTADLIWHWLGAIQGGEREESYLDQCDEFEEIVELLGNIEFLVYETHVVKVSALLPGKFFWDYIQFVPN